MAAINWDSVQFYQPPTKASLSRKRVFRKPITITSTVAGAEKSFTAPEPSSGLNGRLWGDDQIEIMNMTEDTQADAIGTVDNPYFCEWRFIILDTSYGLCNTSDLNHESEDDDYLPTLEEVLSAKRMEEYE